MSTQNAFTNLLTTPTYAALLSHVKEWPQDQMAIVGQALLDVNAFVTECSPYLKSDLVVMLAHMANYGLLICTVEETPTYGGNVTRKFSYSRKVAL